MSDRGQEAYVEGREPAWHGVPGIVIAWRGATTASRLVPRIQAFVWGGKVRPTPILPYGRWKGAA